MDKNSKIYVAGHLGLVGSAILKILQAKGYKNIIYRRSCELDLRNQKDTEKFFEEERPEYVFLAAAKVGGILANNTYKGEFIYDNIIIGANVIQAAYKYGVKKLLNFGSSCIYPKLAPQPIKEEYLLTGSLEPTNEPYAIAKIAVLKLCQYYNIQYGANFFSVMPNNLYGLNDNFNLETSHVLAALTRKFYLAKLLKEENFGIIKKDILKTKVGFGLDEKINLDDKESIKQAFKSIGVTGDYVVIWGDGEPYREFLCVDDLADASLFLMEKYDYKDAGYLINIGTGEDIQLKELAQFIKRLIGFEGGIKYDSAKPNGTHKKLLDVSKMKALGWEAKIRLAEGLKKLLSFTPIKVMLPEEKIDVKQ